MTEQQALAALIDHETYSFKRLPHFPAKVVVQHGDLTVDVEPDSKYLPGLSALPLRTFVPGAVTKLQTGSRVVVVFENGDESSPVAVPLYDQDAGGLLELEVHASVKASVVAPAVRLGSLTAVEQLILGTSFRAAHSAWHVALSAVLIGGAVLATAAAAALGTMAAGFTAASHATGLTPPDTDALTAAATACGTMATAFGVFGGICTAAATALSTFEAGAPAYVSNVSKTL